MLDQNGWGFRPSHSGKRFRLCMKKHYINRSKPRATKRDTKEIREYDGEKELNRTAEELDVLARMRLPDRVLRGILTGYEDDIRQNAIVLALGWYLRQQTDPEFHPEYPWHAPRAIAAALRIQRRDHIRSLKGESEGLRSLPAESLGTPLHPSMIRICDWPSSAKQSVIRVAIRIALRDGRVSTINAAVGIGLLVEGISAKEMAKRRNISPSAIYQHLGRVRRAIPDIIEGIEIPFNELF